jgi:alcohol dehydrogenase (quinone), cytochrome c subunit
MISQIHTLTPSRTKLLVAAAAFTFTLTSARASETQDQALILRGEYLAKLGDCVACHTAPGGKPFAGGLPMTTPLGRIYSTNITPDSETGIGRYTISDFDGALRRGIAKDGHNLYPAMPYPSYAKVNDADTRALYAYFMRGVKPVRQPNRTTDIKWPMNMRWPLKLWNVVFLDTSTYQNKPANGNEWNRGAYIVQGLGHCGSCHTPRGVGFQEKALDESGSAFLSGAKLDGWFASNLTSEYNVGLGRWNAADTAAFLKTGANRHATAFGPMTDVVNNSTQSMTDADVLAVSTYLKTLPPIGGNGSPKYAFDPKVTKVTLGRPANDDGARLYATYCMHCHGVDGRGFTPMLAPLAGNPNVLERNPSSLVNITLNGTGDLVIGGIPAPFPMPKYAGVLSDQQIAEVLTFVRTGWNNNSSAVSSTEVAKLREETSAKKPN